MNVTIYGTVNCAACATLKNLLDREGIQYNYEDIMDDRNSDAVQKHRIRSLPTTVITYNGGVDVLTGSDSFNTIVSLCKVQ